MLLNVTGNELLQCAQPSMKMHFILSQTNQVSAARTCDVFYLLCDVLQKPRKLYPSKIFYTSETDALNVKRIAAYASYFKRKCLLCAEIVFCSTIPLY
jgi:hypothetical protein